MNVIKNKFKDLLVYIHIFWLQNVPTVEFGNKNTK